jgi:hypothetical protein
MTTRDNEIKQHATDISNTWLPQDYQQVAYDAAVKMAKWADQNPREGLWDAEKACQIIHEVINSDTIGQYLIFDDENIDFDSELFFDDLLRAMED